MTGPTTEEARCREWLENKRNEVGLLYSRSPIGSRGGYQASYDMGILDALLAMLDERERGGTVTEAGGAGEEGN